MDRGGNRKLPQNNGNQGNTGQGYGNFEKVRESVPVSTNSDNKSSNIASQRKPCPRSFNEIWLYRSKANQTDGIRFSVPGRKRELVILKT